MSFLRFMLVSLILLSTTLWAGVGKVALLKGEATLERGVQKLALQNGTSLEEKDTIKTSKDAQVQLMFEDKTVITLGSESEFKIEEYLNDTKNPKAKFKFNQGAFKTITGQIGKTAPDNFKLETKTATIGIRGTIVAGNVPPPPPPAMPPLPEAIFCLGGTITVAPITMPNIIVIVPTGSFTQMLTPSTPPSPPVIFTPADLQQLNQNLGGTPPPPPSGNNPPQGGNTPPTGNPDGGNDSPPPPPAPTPSPAPVPQTFTPTAAASALQSNLQSLVQEGVVEEIADELGIPSQELQDQMQNQVCPSGTTGTYPNCIAMSCPENTIGIYPNCVALACPEGTTGTYPNCTTLTCPTGTTGTYPNCVAQTCPEGTTGTYPNCTILACPTGTTGTYPNCTAQTCPSGTTGTYPNCTAVSSGGSGGTSTTYNSERDVTLSGMVMHAFDEEGYFYGTGSGMYSLIVNDLSTNIEGVYFEFFDINAAYISDKNVSWSVDLPNTAAGTTYSSYASVGGLTMSFTSPDGNVSVASGTSTLYADNMQEFFINYFEATSSAAFGSLPFTYIETAGTYANYANIGNFITEKAGTNSLVARYVAPYDTTDDLWVHFGNDNFLKYELPTNSSDDFFIALGRVYDDYNKTSLSGLTYSANADFSAYSHSDTNVSAYGHIYGSQYQGLDLSAVYVDQNGTYNVGGMAAYRDICKTLPAAQPLGYLELSGYANALTPSAAHASTSKNMLYKINRATGETYTDPAYSKLTLSSFSIANLQFTDSSMQPTSAYINDDYFATIGINDDDGLGQGWLVAVDNFGQSADDYVSWGWYGYKGAQTVLPSTWVAGSFASEAETFIDSLPQNTTLTYLGKSMGGVKAADGVLYPIVMDSANETQIMFELGGGYPIVEAYSWVKFKDARDTSWVLTPSNMNSSFSNGNFFTTFTDANLTSSSLAGSFYGPHAESIGGSFGAITDTNESVLGVFKAAQNSLNVFALTGLAISSYDPALDGNISNSVSDSLTLVAMNGTDMMGGVVLMNESTPRGIADLNGTGTITSTQNFNTSKIQTDATVNNDYVSWGYWAATEVDGNATLMAGTNLWVAGKDATAAAAFIETLKTSNDIIYRYDGKVLGSVYDGSWGNIVDDVTNDVRLVFNFGNTASNAIDSGASWVKFTAHSKLWNMTPSAAAVNAGKFAGTLSGAAGASNDVSGVVNGQFFGTQAQALGGTFKATADGGAAKALGVLKAIGGVYIP